MKKKEQKCKKVSRNKLKGLLDREKQKEVARNLDPMEIHNLKAVKQHRIEISFLLDKRTLAEATPP